MGFRLLPKSVTLSDLEWPNGCVFCVISRNSVAFRDYYIKMVEDTPCFLQQNCSAKIVDSGDILFMAIFTGDHP